jgi:hypothetical protein
MNDDELDPVISAAICDVAPASDSLRNQHIAAALGEIAVTRKTPRSAWLSAAAAVIVLLAGAAAIVRLGGTSTDSSVSPQISAVSTVPVKGSACSAGLAAYTIVGTYSSANAVREVWSSRQNLVIVNQDSCAVIDTIAHPAMAASKNICDFQRTSDVQVVGTYSVVDTEFTLIATTHHLQIFGGQSCGLIASYPLPVQS